MRLQDKKNKIIDIMSFLEKKVENYGILNRHDINIELEVFCKKFFEIIYHYSFSTCPIKCNQAWYDLKTDDDKIFFQVTTNKKYIVKFNDTIEKFINSDKYDYAEYLYLIYFYKINKKPGTNDNKMIIYDFKDLIRIVGDLSNANTIDELFDYCCSYEGIASLPALNFEKKPICDNYIERSCSSVLSKDLSLYEIIKYEKRLIILGDAATGKSQELRNLYNKLIDNNTNTPFFYELKNYLGEDIENIIPSKFHLYDNPILLFDGYDELETNYIRIFVSKLNSFIGKFCNIKIVVTSRNNFYDKNQETQPLTSFSLCSLNELSNKDIENYVETRNADKFYFDKIESSFLTNPFYLQALVDLSLKQKKVKNKCELMDELLEISYENYEIKNKIINKQKLLIELENKAFELVSKGTTQIDQFDENILKFDWIKKEKNHYSFIHNNYKEFLAARYLSKFEIKELKVKICLFINNRFYIKPQFFNIMGFLIQLRKDDKELLEFLKENGKEVIFNSELNSFSNEEKSNLIASILEELKIKKSWIDYTRYSIDKIANWSDNLTTVNKLYEYLNLINYRTVNITIIEILLKTECVKIIKQKIITKMLEWLSDDIVFRDTLLLSHIIEFLSILYGNTIEIKYLCNKYINDNRSAIRYCVYEIIYNNHLSDEYIEIIISNKQKWKHKLHSHSEDEISDFPESFFLPKIINDIQNQDILTKIGEKLLYDNESENIVLNSWFDNIENIVQINRKLKNFLLTCFVTLKQSYNVMVFENRITHIIIKQNLSDDCYQVILNSNYEIYYKLKFMSKIATKKIIKKIIQSLQENPKLINNFIENLRCHNENTEDIEKELGKYNIKYDNEKSIFSNQEQKMQKEWDDIFDKQKIKNSLIEIFELCDKDNIIWNDIPLEDIYNQYPHYILNYFNNNRTYNKKIIEESKITIDEQINFIQEYINKFDKIQIKNEQKVLIKKWCDKEIKKIDCKKINIYNVSIILLAKLILKLNFIYDDELYEKLILIEWKFNDETSDLLMFIQEKLGVQKVCNSIVRYINEGVLQKYNLKSRLKYLYANNCGDAKVYILSCLKNFMNIDESLYNIFIEYAIKFNFIEDAMYYSNQFSALFKIIFIRYLIENNKIEFAINYGKNEIEKNNEYSIEFAKILISANNDFALEYYIKYIKNNIKELEKGNLYEIPEFNKISNFESVDKLFYLLNLSYNLKKNKEIMQSSINESLFNIAMQSIENLNYIINRLDEIASNSELTLSNYQYCYIDKMINGFLWKNNAV